MGRERQAESEPDSHEIDVTRCRMHTGIRRYGTGRCRHQPGQFFRIVMPSLLVSSMTRSFTVSTTQ